MDSMLVIIFSWLM